jgi:hypothetical protein
MVVSGEWRRQNQYFLIRSFHPSHIGGVYTSSIHIYAAISSKRFHLSRSSLIIIFSQKCSSSVVHTRGNKCKEYKFNSTRHTLARLNGVKREKRMSIADFSSYRNVRRSITTGDSGGNEIQFIFIFLKTVSTDIQLDLDIEVSSYLWFFDFSLIL